MYIPADESSPPRALIVVDHGSRLSQANATLEQVVAQMKARTKVSYVTIEPAHMELAAPSLETAFLRCVEAGAVEIIVCLFFLSPGRHVMQDIPRMLEALQRAYPGVRCAITAPLAPDPCLADLLLQRAEQTSV